MAKNVNRINENRKAQYYIIDFDSTLVQVEGLDELAKLSLKGKASSEQLEDIQEITRLGMEGRISITESLTRRLNVINASRSDLASLVKLLKKRITPSVLQNREFLKKNANKIYVFSSGFKEYVAPIISSLGLKESHLFANTFKFDNRGQIVGFDTSNVMAKEGGKVTQLKALKLSGEIFVIGDGYTDYQMREAGAADHFFAFTENVARESVINKADKVVSSFDEFLFVNKLPMRVSYPKSKIKVLLLENVHPAAVDILTGEGFSVETGSDALDVSELKKCIKDVSLLGLRSKTTLANEALKNADRLLAVGAFCIGTEQIDLKACAQKGVAVFNAPYSNTRSVVELALGEIIMLMRRTFETSQALHSGKWFKSAAGSFEVRGKKLGIIGYGNIGSQLSVLAESMGMEVYYYDVSEKLTLGNAKKCRNLTELLKLSDIITVHVDGRTSNRNLISKNEFSAMKPGVIFLNLSRGHVVDLEALVAAIKDGKVGGVAVDVYPLEPKSNKEEFISELRGLPNVILTPHVGGSTAEAQKNIGEYVARRLINYINTGASGGSVNFPQIDIPPVQRAHRLLHIHKNVPGILAHLNSIFAKNKINILGQYLKTTDEIGYVITDVDKEYNSKVVKELRQISETIKFRVIY